MTDNIWFDFQISPRNINRMLVSSVISACINTESKYEELRGYRIMFSDDFGSGSLEKAIDELSKTEGVIYLEHKIIGDYSIAFHPSKYKDLQKLGKIRLSIYGGNFEYEDRGSKYGEHLINIAKSIWNSLDEKPIYAYGDDSLHLPPTSDPHPNDDDIIALDIPINKFWLNFYGKDMIEKYGDDALMEKEKGYRTEKLDDGLLVITDVVPTSYKGGWKEK